ncbi:MAG: PQQ-binding-like beta-propeller repeat protein, partial [Nitrososphaera sp.]|nr:PQQ-binding-like beta-propeller repeat protein [Nitrososphaera sp.]
MTFHRLLRIAALPVVLLLSLLGLSGVSEESNATGDWPAFRHDTRRSAHQPIPSALSVPALAKSLHIGWSFSPPGAKAFRASPVVFKGRVYIGNGSGRLYALDAETGALLWQFPKASDPPLVSKFTCAPSSLGIASSATIARIRADGGGLVNAVIFGAPDPSIELGLGSGRLFALNRKTGAVIWKSDPIASLTGLTFFSTA